MLFIFTGTPGIMCLLCNFEMLNPQVHCVSEKEEGARALSALLFCFFSNMLGNERGSCLLTLAFNSDFNMQQFPLFLLTGASSSVRVHGPS